MYNCHSITDKKMTMKKLISLILITLAFTAFAIAAYTLSGKIAVGKKPIKDVDVILKKVPGGEIVHKTKTGETGDFEITGLQTGMYTLEIPNIQVEKENETITGRTVLKEKENQAEFVARLTNPEGTVIFEAQLNDKGVYRFEGISVGTWSLSIDYSF